MICGIVLFEEEVGMFKRETHDVNNLFQCCGERGSNNTDAKKNKVKAIKNGFGDIYKSTLSEAPKLSEVPKLPPISGAKVYANDKHSIFTGRTAGTGDGCAPPNEATSFLCIASTSVRDYVNRGKNVDTSDAGDKVVNEVIKHNHYK